MRALLSIPVAALLASSMAPVVRAQTEGIRERVAQLEGWLCEITGYDAVSLQPNAGSQGELAGLLAIRAYHQARGEAELGPDLTHATAEVGCAQGQPPLQRLSVPVVGAGAPLGQRHRRRRGGGAAPDCCVTVAVGAHDPDARGPEVHPRTVVAVRPARARHGVQRADRDDVGQAGRPADAAVAAVPGGGDDDPLVPRPAEGCRQGRRRLVVLRVSRER